MIDLGIVPGGEKYDVFISYSGAQRAWVRKKVYEPLIQLQKIEKPKENLKVFFDQEEIEEGTPFVHKYKNAIVNSTMFVPILTKDYFESIYCKKEMSFADGRAETDLIYIYPFTFDLEIVPDVYNDKNIIELDENSNSDFISKLKKRLDKIQQQKSGLSKPESEDVLHEEVNEPPILSKPKKVDSDVQDTVEEVGSDKSTQEIKPIEDNKKDKKKKREKEKEETIKKQKKDSKSKKSSKKKKKVKKAEKTAEQKKKRKETKSEKSKSKKRSNKKENKKSKVKKSKKYAKKIKNKKEQKKKKRKRSEKKATKRHHKTSKKGSKKKKKSKQSKKKKK
ncbi:MAG: toll/interleukin-1 receptor domain-containing protein [Bacteroidia bacterium]|nr:toll/interleukin-1 receptor domain-containing protein [Bacteroidia bacterium]